MTGSLTSTDLIAAATGVLEEGGYRIVRDSSTTWNTTSTRLFEDDYNVVGIAAFNTAGELVSTWADLQASLVDVISRQIGRSENKAWDGYLVLMTPSFAPSEGTQIEEIRYNTARLRKLVGTGDELASANDVGRLLRPLLPLGQSRGAISQSSVLDVLPGLLASSGVDPATTAVLIRAYVDQKPLVEALHNMRTAQ